MKEICNKMLSKHSAIKRVAGKIESVNSTYTIAVVSIVGSNVQFSLLNKSNQILEVGDYVWIHYWQTINDGYIALKNGSGDYQMSAGGAENNSIISIDNAFVLCEGEHEYITTHTYNANDEYGTTSFIKSPIGAIGQAEYFSDLCDMWDAWYPTIDHAVHVDYSYLYTATFTLLNGSQITANWVPGFNWYNIYNSSQTRIPIPVDIVKSNNYSMYQALQIQAYTPVSRSTSTGFEYDYYLETRNLSLSAVTDNGMYSVALVKSASTYESEVKVELVPYRSTPYDLSQFRIELVFTQYRRLAYWGRDAEHWIGYDPYIANDSLIVGLMAVGLVYGDGYWKPASMTDSDTGVSSIGLIVPLYPTITNANTHVGNMIDTKERSVVV